MANGNSRAARSARAKKQLRDSKGRWIEMGRSRVTWYSSNAGKNLAGTAMKVTDDGDNAIVSVTDDQGVATDHVVSGKSLTIVNSKVTLPTTGKEPTNPKFYEKQAKNIAALELPEGADEKTQAAFDNAYETVKIQDKISPGIAKSITDANGEAVNYGDLVETKKGPAFVIGNIPASNSSVLAFADGSVKTTKGHTFTVKDKGEIVPEQDSSDSEAPSEAPESTPAPEQAPAETKEQAPGDSEAVEAWKVGESYLMQAPVGTTVKGEDGSHIGSRGEYGWTDENGDSKTMNEILDELLDHTTVQVSQEDSTSSEDQEQAPAPEAEEAPAPEENEDIFANTSVVQDGTKVTATLPDGSTVSVNNYTGKKFAVIARPKIQGGSEWEVRLANDEDSALQETGVTDQVFSDIKVMPISTGEDSQDSQASEPEEAPTQMTEPELEAWEKELLSGEPVEAEEDDADSAEEQQMVDDAIADAGGESDDDEEIWSDDQDLMSYMELKNGAQLISPSGETWTKQDGEYFSDSGEILTDNAQMRNRVIDEGLGWIAKTEAGASVSETPIEEPKPLATPPKNSSPAPNGWTQEEWDNLADWEKSLLADVNASVDAKEQQQEAPAPKPQPEGKITAQNFVKNVGEDENGKYYTDANGDKVYEGELVDYNKSKGTAYNATVAKVNKNNVILHVPELGDKPMTAQQHKVFKKQQSEEQGQNEEPVEEQQEVQSEPQSSDPDVGVTEQELDYANENSVIKDQHGEDIYAKNADGTWDYLPEAGGEPVTSDEIMTEITGAYEDTDGKAFYKLEEATTANTVSDVADIDYNKTYGKNEIPEGTLDSAPVGTRVSPVGTDEAYVKNEDGTWHSEFTGSDLHSKHLEASLNKHGGYNFKKASSGTDETTDSTEQSQLTPGPLDPSTVTEEEIASLPTGSMISNVSVEDGSQLVYEKQSDGTWNVKETITAEPHNNTTSKIINGIMKTYPEDDFELLGTTNQQSSSSSVSSNGSPAQNNEKLSADQFDEYFVASVPVGDGIQTVAEDGSFNFVYKKEGYDLWNSYDNMESSEPIGDALTDDELVEIAKDFPDAPYTYKQANPSQAPVSTPEPEVQPEPNNQSSTDSSGLFNGQAIDKADISVDSMKEMPIGSAFKYTADGMPGSYFMKKTGDDSWEMSNGLAKKANAYQESTQSMFDDFIADEPAGNGKGSFEYVADFNKGDASFSDPEPSELDYITLNQAPKNTKITVDGKGFTKNATGNWIADTDIDVNDSEAMGNIIEETPNAIKTISYPDKKSPEEYQSTQGGLPKNGENITGEVPQSTLDNMPVDSAIQMNNNGAKLWFVKKDGQWSMVSDPANPSGGAPLESSGVKPILDAAITNPNVSLKYVTDPSGNPDPTEGESSSSYSDGQKITNPLTTEEMDAMPVGSGFQNKTSISTMWFVKKDDGKWLISTNSNLSNSFDMDTAPLQVSLNGMVSNSANTLKYVADAKSNPNPDLVEEPAPSTPQTETSSAPHPNGAVDPEMQYDEALDIAKKSPVGAKFWPNDLDNYFGYTKTGENEWQSDTGVYKSDDDVAYYLSNEGIPEDSYTYTSPGGSMATPSSSSDDSDTEFTNGVYTEATPNLAAKIENAPVGAKLTPGNMSSNYQMTKDEDGDWVTDVNSYFTPEEVVEHIISSGDKFTATGGNDSTTGTSSGSGSTETPVSAEDDKTIVDGIVDIKASNMKEKLYNAPVGTILTPGDMSNNYQFTKLENNSWKTDTGMYYDDDQVVNYFGYKNDTYTATNAAEPTPVTPEVPTLDTKGWKKLSGAQGSNDGGIYENPDGEQYYLKMPASEAHAKNEVLADKFYQMAGIETSKLELSDYGGDQLGTASKMLEGSEKNLESKLNDPAYKQKLQEGFAMDAWLANWDVAGTGFDNVVTDANGNPVRVDPGGALLFRAMGSPKGDNFGDEVGELDTLRDGSNSYSKAIFGDMTDEQIATSISKVAAITPQQIDALVDSMEFDETTANLYKTKLKKRRQNLIDRRKEFVPEPTFAGADANAYNQQGIGVNKSTNNSTKPTSAFSFGTIDNPQDDPLYGAPQPVEPTPVPYQTFNISQPKINWEGRDEWLAAVEQRFLDNPAKNAPTVQQSANWNKIQSILDGDTEHIEYLVTKKYLTPEMAETARTSIQTAKDNLDTDEATKQMQKEKDEYEAKKDQYSKDLAQYQQDIAKWNAVNGTNATNPAPQDVQFPAPSTEELWEETNDWSKANHGTFSAAEVFDRVQNSNDTANHGLSMAIDSDQIENHDVRVTRIVGTDGKEQLRFEFKLTSDKGDQFLEEIKNDYEKQNGMSYPKLQKSNSTGLYMNTGTTTYDESKGSTYKKTLEGNRNVTFRAAQNEEMVNDYNAGGTVLRRQSTYHNQITLTMPADSTPEAFAKTLQELGIKANPTTQGDMRVLAENKLMKAFGKYNPGDEDKTAIDPKKNFQFQDRQTQLDYIKEKYGITVDDVSVVTDESGHNRIQLSDEAAQKLVDRYDIGFFQHTFTYNNPTVEALTRIMTGAVPALRPAADRGMNGVSATGQSAEADHQTGAGDYVFTTPKSTHSSKQEGVQMDPVKILKNLDIWANKNDDWGAKLIDTSRTPHETLDQNHGSVHELMVQSSIPVAWWSHVTVANQTDKTKLIENLTKAGVTAVNGKSLADFIHIRNSSY